MVNPYHIAISAYALHVADSTEKEFAFGKLHAVRRERGWFFMFISDLICCIKFTFR